MTINWRTAIAAFLLGCLLGWAAGTRVHHGWDRPWEKGKMMERFERQLHLNAEQKKQVDAILEDTRAKIQALRQDVHPKFEQIRSDANAKIRTLLDPGQQAEFDKMLARWEKRLKKFEAGRDQKSS